MFKKLLQNIKLKNVEVLLYKSADIPTISVSFEPYGILKKELNYRETEFRVLDNNSIVHRSIVFGFSPTLHHLKCKGLLIGNCYTDPNYRGQSVYSRMLQHIVMKNREKKMDYYVFVHPDNKASIAGIEKAGFKKVLLFKAKKRFYFFYNEEITRF